MSERRHPLQAAADGAPAGPRTVAAAWLARKRSGGMTEQEARDLSAWLAQDPAHRQAYALAQAVWEGAAAMRANPAMMAMRERARRRLYWPGRALAAGAAAAVLALGVFAGWSLIEPPAPAVTPIVGPAKPPRLAPGQLLETQVGERATASLPDGSVVTLSTDSRLRVRAGQDIRLVSLERGQAYFQVAKDRARPFVVEAAGRRVVATGTAFEVRVETGRVAVTLVEGKVHVEAPIRAAEAGGASRLVQTAQMEPGSQLVAADGEPWAVEEVDAAKAVSWLRDKLVFQNEPLGAVAAELNRYSDRRIVIADPAIAAQPVSGSFRTGDVEESVAALVAFGLARVSAETADVIELSAAPAKKSSARM